jgi:hypothetical protein
MKSRTTVIVLIVAALLIAAAVALRGHGHGLLARWMPAIHGHR